MEQRNGNVLGLWIMLAVIVLLLVANLLFVSFVFHRQQMMMCKMKMGMMDKGGCEGDVKAPGSRCLSGQSQCGPAGMAMPMGGCPMQGGPMMRSGRIMRGGMMNRGGMMMQRMPMSPMGPHMQGRMMSPHGPMGTMMMRGQSMTAPAMPMMQAHATRVMPAIPLTPAMEIESAELDDFAATYEDFCRSLPEGARIQAVAIEDIDPEVLERIMAEAEALLEEDFEGIRLEIDGDELIHARTIRISDDRIACPAE
jgi:hypothetical protein